MNIKNLPDWAKAFVVDFAATALTLILGLNLIIPNTLEEAKAQAAIVGVGLIGAAVNAARRNSGRFILWLQTQIGWPE